MARDVQRIDDTLDKVRKVWYSNPDMRLGQLILNLATVPNGELYFLEDDELVERLEEVYD